MAISQNKLKNILRTDWLKKCLDEYFAPGQFVFDQSHLEDIKWRLDGYYAVMLFNVGGDLWIADVAGTQSGTYEVCNDGDECRDLDEWKSLKVDRHSDGYSFKSDEEE